MFDKTIDATIDVLKFYFKVSYQLAIQIIKCT